MRRPAVLAALVVALALTGVTSASALTPNDVACRSGLKLSDGVNSAEVLAYQACRFDKLDAAVKGDADAPNVEPSPTATPTATPTVTPTATPTPSTTPIASPTPTVTPTTTTPSPTDEPTSASPSPTASPSAAGFPDASTTGVPDGTTLKRIPEDVKSGTGWHYDSRGWVTIDGAGTTFAGYRVGVNVDITASNVTVKNNLLVLGDNSWGFSLRHTKGVTIDRNTIHGGTTASTICDNAVRDIYGDSDDVTITGNDIYACSSGINHLNRGGLIRDNYIHDLGAPCPPNDSTCGHYNGIQLGAGSGPLMTIDHNTILISLGYTDAIMLANDDGAQANRTITNNLLAGGAYTFYGAGYASGSATGIKFTGNKFSTRYFAKSGQYGPVVYFQPGNVWANNTWADGPNAGKPVNP